MKPLWLQIKEIPFDKARLRHQILTKKLLCEPYSYWHTQCFMLWESQEQHCTEIRDAVTSRPKIRYTTMG